MIYVDRYTKIVYMMLHTSNYSQTLCVAQTLTLRMSCCRLRLGDVAEKCVYAVFSGLGLKVFRG